MRVLLINAPPARIVERMYDTPEFTRLALACLGAVLRGRGHEVAAIDAKFERLDHDQVLERVASFGPQLVGLTAFTNEIKSAARVAADVKRRWPQVRTIVGGVHVSAIPERTLEEFPAFDFGCIGEGELTLAELVDVLEAGGDPAGVAGLVLRSAGKAGAVPASAGPVRTAPRAVLLDLDDLPMPAWDLMPPAVEYTVMSSRGCPYSCPFCQNPNGRRVRARSVEAFVGELAWIAEHTHARRLFISDEIFTLDRERTLAILDALVARGLHQRLAWMAQTHVNFVDEDLFARMRAAGAYLVGFGIETGDADMLRALRKGLIDHRPVLAARAAARRAGLPVETYFIIGQEHETLASAWRSLRLAFQLNPELPIFGIMVPYPGTRVAALAERGEGGFRIRSRDWDDYNKQIGDALEFEGLSRRQLELLQLAGYLGVFLLNGRLLDLGRFVWRFRQEGFAFLRKLLWPRGWSTGALSAAGRPAR